MSYNETDEGIKDFLSEMEAGSLELDEALRTYGHLLTDTALDQDYRDYMDSRAAMKRTLKKAARDNEQEHIMSLLD